MYQDFIGKQIIAIVANRGDANLEYIGTLESVDKSKNIATLSNVSIRIVMHTLGRSILGEGSSLMTFHQGLAKSVINLDYIVSINI